MTPESLAKLFHDTYERLAPHYHYQTRRESAVPWDEVPEPNRSLMIAVAGEVQREVEARIAELELERDGLRAENERLTKLVGSEKE